ncbi:transposase [uncultured Lamprocystis sp.]|jgi:putative transposase|uniref:REP-associated tyrosine transposase n=2 Tax=uncultured Lamprocystis sp. TaxID=543132 RepID=UPI0025D07F7F|nr:transposase [uncultured Lamprocystis sp.]
MQYRRMMIAGATYFFTVNLADRSRRLLVEQVADLREVVRRVRQAHPFEILAWCVLPEHLHAVWTLPPGDADYAMRWTLIKAGFSRCVVKDEYIRDSRLLKGERGIWQRRYWEHVIRDDRDLERHIDYTHFNPVKHGYVQAVREWPYSSFHAHVRKGWLSEDWGCTEVPDGDFGEHRRLG